MQILCVGELLHADSEVMQHEILEEFEGDFGDFKGTLPIQHEDSNY